MNTGLLHRIRRQVVWVAATVLGLAAAAIFLTAVPALPVIGAALATIAVAVQSLGRDLKADRCMNCGESIAAEPRGTHGFVCPKCGAIDDTPKA
jgi:hypothetical protein